jgi:hypothetical protein
MNRRACVPVLIPLWIGLGLLASQQRTSAHEPVAEQPKAAIAAQPVLVTRDARAIYGSPAYRPTYLGVYAAGGHKRGRYVVALTGSPAHYYGHHAWLEQWPFVPGMYFSHPPIKWGQWPVAYKVEAIGPGVYAYRPIYPSDPEWVSLPQKDPSPGPQEVPQDPRSGARSAPSPGRVKTVPTPAPLKEGSKTDPNDPQHEGHIEF